jgi:hypothetical protein
MPGRFPFRRSPRPEPAGRPPQEPPVDATVAPGGVPEGAPPALEQRPLTETERMMAQGQQPLSDPLAVSSRVDMLADRMRNPQEIVGPRAPWRNINTDRLDAPDSINQILDAVSADTSNGGYVRQSMDEIKAKADDLDDRQVLKDLIGTDPGELLNADQLYRARVLMVNSAKQVRDAAQRMEADGPANRTQMQRLEYQRMLDRHYVLQSAVQGKIRDLARALNSLKLVPDIGDARILEEAIDRSGGTRNIDARIRLIANAETLEQASRDIGIASQVGNVAENLVNYRTVNLLWNPQTHVVNTSSNAITALLSPVDRAWVGAQSQVFGSGEAFPREGYELFLGQVTSILDAWSMSKDAWRTGESKFGLRKVDDAIHSASEFGLGHDNPMAVALDYAVSTAFAPGRFLTAQDEFFKAIAFRGEMRARAYRAARQEGLEGDALAARMKELLAGPNQEKIIDRLRNSGFDGDELDLEFMATLKREEVLFREMYRDSVEFAKYQTFTDSLKSDIGRDLGKVQRNPAVRLIVPFYKTLANITSYAGERSPLAVVTPAFYRNLREGGVAHDEAIARFTYGSAMAVAFIAMSAEGKLTGSGPPNPRLRAVYEELGYRPYLFNIGGFEFNYGRLDPAATPIAIIADMAEHYRYATDDKQREHILTVMAASFAEVMADKSMMTGFSELTRAISGAMSGDQNPQNYIGKFMASWIPLYGLQKAVKKEVDGVVRSTDIGDPMTNALAYVRNTIPIPALYEDLPLQLNFWGEPVSPKGMIGPDFFSPFYEAKYKDDDATYELGVNGVGPSRLGCQISFEGMAIDLHQIDTGKGPGMACHDYQQIVGQRRREAVTDLISRDSYRKLLPGPPSESGGEFTRGDALQTALNSGLIYGKEEFLSRYPAQSKELMMQSLMKGNPAPPLPGFIQRGRQSAPSF